MKKTESTTRTKTPINFSDSKIYLSLVMVFEKLNQNFQVIYDFESKATFLHQLDSKQTFPFENQIFEFILDSSIIEIHSEIGNTIEVYHKTAIFQTIYSFIYEKEQQFSGRSKMFEEKVENLVNFVEFLAKRMSRATATESIIKCNAVRVSQKGLRKYLKDNYMLKCVEIEEKEIELPAKEIEFSDKENFYNTEQPTINETITEQPIYNEQSTSEETNEK